MVQDLKGMRGLTFESALSPATGEVGRLENLRRTGVPSYNDYQNEPELRYRKALRDAAEQEQLLSLITNWRPTRNERMASHREALLSANPSEHMGLEAAAAGYGESRFDKNITHPSQLLDIEDSRARQQSTLGILGNSIAKMGVLAATTAADSWVGLPSGLINLATEAVTGNIHSMRDAADAVISNPVSSYLQEINDKSEDAFRNYQTAEERGRHWWENMFTANFIGDTLIKNAGFTIGAVLGGKMTVNAMGNAMNMREVRDAFKGLAAELELSGKSASEVVKLLAEGSTQLEKKAAVKALAESATKLKNAELSLKMAGGLMAGMGEARIEAINAADELDQAITNAYGDLDEARTKALDRAVRDMRLSGIDINTPEGMQEFSNRKADIDSKYAELREQIAHEKAAAANTVFALNVPLLTAGDMAQWGKLMLGSYALDRNVVNGIRKVAERTAISGAKATPEELIKATKYATKGNKLTETLGKVAAGSKNILIEAQEEMNQSLFSATAQAKSMGDITEFTQRLYDPMAITDTITWLNAAKEGMRQSWLNKDDWVEGFAGGFMGFLGLPSISVKVDEKTGKEKPRLTMEGGIWSPIREYNDLQKSRKELVEVLNSKLESPEFLQYYYGKIGNRHFDSIKEDAVARGDKKGYEKADHAQLINDAITFARAGRLQDFIDIIDSFDNVSDENINTIKALFPDSSDIQKMTTAGMRTLINDNVDKLKRQLDSYMKIADDIKTVYGNTISDAQVAELTWQTAHLDEIEHDLKEIISHPETASLLSEYKGEKSDTAKDLTDYEIVSSIAYHNWLVDKYNDKKDTTSKSDLTSAINDAADAQYDMSERSRYIDNISALSEDPELVMKRQIKLQKERERLLRLSKLVHASSVLSTTDKLSDFITAMEEIGETIPDETLADIKKEADKGNITAGEYLMVHDIDSSIDEQIRRIGEKSGATEEQIKQAKDAWNYLKHNSDSAYELTRRHAASDIASDVAGAEAVNLLNDAVDAVLKSRSLYGRIAKRPAKKEETGPEVSSGESTKFKTTGQTLTKKKYEEIVSNLQDNYDGDSFSGAVIFKVDLAKADILFDGKPANGIVYLYYNNGKIIDKKGKQALPTVYDQYGNEIDIEDIKKLTGPKGQGLTVYLSGDDFPVNGYRKFSVLTDRLAKKWQDVLPVGRKKTGPVKKDTVKADDATGSKTSPHKYIAPNPDIALLGGDSHAVAETLKNLPEDSELRFGILEDDGPIYILAGDSNMRIGTLPREGMDSYSGLEELSALIRQEYEASKDRRNTDGMWISENYVNHMREKRTTGFETIEDNVPLDEIPGFEGIKEPMIMFVYDEAGGQKQVFSDENIGISDIQLTGTLTSGFAYLLIPSGKKYIPVMLYTQNANVTTLDLNNPEVTGKGFGKRVSDAIDKVVEAVTKTDKQERIESFKRWAWNSKESSTDSLQRLLYFNSKGKTQVQFFIKETCPQHPGWFTNDNVVMVINVHNTETGEDDWTPIRSDIETSIRDQIIDTFNKLDYETEDGRTHTGPIAQIHPKHFDNLDDLHQRIRELIDSKMLLTDVKSFDLTMPSFIMDYWSVSQNKFVRPSHAPVKPKTGPKVTTKTTKAKGKEKIATVQLGGKDIQYNMTTGQIKVGKGKWFDKTHHEKSNEKEIRDLGFKSAETFMRTIKALAYIADRYGNSTTGEGRIGNRVLLKGFTGRKDEGFVQTGDGGRFMTPEELVEFKDELKNAKKKTAEKRAAAEAKRVAEVASEETEQPEESEDTLDENTFDQEVVSQKTNAAEVARMETVSNVKEAIEHLKKNAPQYKSFLDYISKIGIYDDVLIELANIVDVNDSRTTGRNVMRFRGSEYTNRIVVGRNSMGYQTMMHELVHAFTSVALKYDNELREDVQTLMDYFQDKVGNARLTNLLGIDGMYAFSSPYEFVAEFFSNPKLQEIAKTIEVPQIQEDKKTNIFSRFIHFISEAIKRLVNRGGNKTLYDKLNDTLYSVVDRQVELNESGKMVFKTKQEFNNARNLADGAKVDGVAFASKIPTVEENLDYRYVTPYDEDRSTGVSELHSYPAEASAPNMRLLGLLQMLNKNDEYASFNGMKRLLGADSVYEFNNGTGSSLIGVKVGEVFITVRAVPDSSYDRLVMRASNSKMPIVIGVSEGDVSYYEKLGMHPVHDSAVNGKVFVANPAFTESDLYNLGTTYRPFADVLDSNSRFVELRRKRYSDAEWNKFSELEKFHARKCIGL